MKTENKGNEKSQDQKKEQLNPTAGAKGTQATGTSSSTTGQTGQKTTDNHRDSQPEAGRERTQTPQGSMQAGQQGQRDPQGGRDQQSGQRDQQSGQRDQQATKLSGNEGGQHAGKAAGTKAELADDADDDIEAKGGVGEDNESKEIPARKAGDQLNNGKKTNGGL